MGRQKGLISPGQAKEAASDKEAERGKVKQEG